MMGMGNLLLAAAEGSQAGAEHVAGAAEGLALGAELEFLGVGLAIVMGTLFALWLLTAFIGRLFIWSERASSLRSRPVVGPVATIVRSSEAEAEAELPIAVIAAAIAVALDAPHRIISVEPQEQSWAIEGRRRIFASHQLR